MLIKLDINLHLDISKFKNQNNLIIIKKNNTNRFNKYLEEQQEKNLKLKSDVIWVVEELL